LGVKAIPAEDLKHRLYERFIKPIRAMAILDYITINGDVADLAFSFNSKYAEVYIWLFDTVIEIAQTKGAVVIVVKGTISHDNDQMDNVKHYRDKVEIYFAEEPTIIETKGMRFYCLPDIHIKPEDEAAIYEYPDNHFDMILGHGSVTETQFMKQESEHAITKNIIYNTKQLLRMCKGPILFGHIHTYMQIQKRLYYISSFERFAHAEEGDKGWMLTAYIPQTGEYIAERVINDLALNFNLYEIKHHVFDKYDADEIIKRISKFVSEFRVDRLTLELTYTASDANLAKLQIIRSYLNRDSRVTKIKLKALSKKEAELIDSVESSIDESKKYLIDKSIPFEEKLQRYIKEEYAEDIPLEKLKILLHSDDLL
jgi:hypothetical protein